MGDWYKKASGSAGIKGTHFQINLLSVVLLNAIRQNIRGWKLSTENIEAGKFDDVVLETDDGAILIQAKHKETKKITLDNILSTNAKNDDFSLPKYFLSYLDVRSKFPVKCIIICTNTYADSGVLKFLTHHNISEENILYYGPGASFHTFDDNLVPDLITNAKAYYENNLKGKGVDETLITNENAKKFLKHLQFYVNYSSGTDLEKAIENLLYNSKSFNCLLNGLSIRDIHLKVRQWFEQPKGEYLTECNANAIFCEIKSEKYRELLKECKVFFKSSNFKIMESKQRIIHFIAEGRHMINLMYVYHNLQQCPMSKILFAGCDYCSDEQKQIIKAFELPQYTYLIISPTELVEESMINEMCLTLKQILENRRYKKIVIVAEQHNLLVERMKSTNVDYEVFDELTLQNLSDGSQEMLLDKKSIILQGEEFSLRELLPEQIPDDYKKSIKSGILEKLVAGENFTVGMRFMDLKTEISKFYIDRKFERKVRNLPEKLYKFLKEREEGLFQDLDYRDNHVLERELEKPERSLGEIITEEEIYNVADKTILICDSPGMGKTTVLKKLAVKIKINNPRICVFRIELNQCTKILRECKLQKRSINIWELLTCTNCIQLTNELEKVLLSLMEIVIMLDGVDEISPDYTGLILDLLLRAEKMQLFKKVFLTTRPHTARMLKKRLNAALFALVPFTEQNQIDFLVRYWMDSLKLEGENIGRCERYAKILINKIPSWIWQWEGDMAFTASPLHAKMLSEVFLSKANSGGWEGIREYLSADEEEAIFPSNINFAKLYEMFIEKKRDFFVERRNLNGDTTVNQALKKQFDECLNYHRSLALKVELHIHEYECFSSFEYNNSNNGDEKIALQMGLIQKANNQLMFVHRTFAEYFVAESIFRELQLDNVNIKFQRFLIDTVLFEYKFQIIRRYLNSFLQNRILSISTNMFKSYLTLVNDACHFNLIHKLAREGNSEIIRFVLKLINFQNINNNIISFSCTFCSKKRRNTLISLKDLIRYEGLNIDSFQGTPLHQATLGGHLHTVKLLIEMGADVNFKTKCNSIYPVVHRKALQRHTALQIAVFIGRRDIVEFLIKCGADVSFQNEKGYAALHVPNHRLDIVECLVKSGVDVNLQFLNGYTALHFAVQGHRLDLVESLVKSGADVNRHNEIGWTALHLAVRYNQFDTLQFLVKSGASVSLQDNWGYAALHFAARDHRLNIVEFLVNSGADVNLQNKEGNTALHSAVYDNELDVLRYLIKSDADVNRRFESGYTASHFVVPGHRLEVVEFLVKSGVDVNSQNENGNTALHFAVRDHQLDVVEFLVKSGADVSLQDNSGFAALHFAVRNHGLKIVELLVKSGADVNCQNETGRTALHIAISNDDFEMVETLVKLGADIGIKSDGHTPLNFAVIRCKDYILKTSLRQQYLWYCNVDKIIRNLNIVKFLVEQERNGGFTSHEDIIELFCFAADMDNLDTVYFIKFLMKYGGYIAAANDENKTLVEFVIESENYSRNVKILYKYDPFFKNRTMKK